MIKQVNTMQNSCFLKTKFVCFLDLVHDVDDTFHLQLLTVSENLF